MSGDVSPGPRLHARACDVWNGARRIVTGPTNESRLLGLCLRISFGGKVQRKDAPILREHRGRHYASLEHQCFRRSSTNGSNASVENR